MKRDPQLTEQMAELVALMTQAGWIESSRVEADKLEIVYTAAGQRRLRQIAEAIAPLGSDFSPRHGLPLLVLLWLDNSLRPA